MRSLDDAAAPGNGHPVLGAAEAQTVSAEIRRLLDNVRSLIYIDPRTLEYLIAAKIAGGHVILADSHGVGKTSLARALAQSIQWMGPGGSNGQGVEAAEFAQADVSAEHVPIESFSRIQCTVDLLPQDILGFSRYELSTSSLIFNRGPIFAHFVLCDEINLLTPKTQGSFFQAMEEQAISIEGNTYHLPDPFFIIATMNLKGAHLFPASGAAARPFHGAALPGVSQRRRRGAHRPPARARRLLERVCAGGRAGAAQPVADDGGFDHDP